MCKNTGEFFKYLGLKRGINNDDIILKKINGDTVKDPFYVVSELSNFFVSNFTVDNRHFPEKIVNDCPNRVFNEMDMIKIIGSLKNSNAAGIDGVPSIIFKQCTKGIIRPLLYFANKSISDSVVPTQWKTAKIIPVHKGGSRNEVNNYRPISITPIACRLVEKLLRESIEQFINEKNVRSKFQHGFVKGRSTSTNLLSFYNKVTKCINSGFNYVAVYLDFKKQLIVFHITVYCINYKKWIYLLIFVCG